MLAKVKFIISSIVFVLVFVAIIEKVANVTVESWLFNGAILVCVVAGLVFVEDKKY